MLGEEEGKRLGSAVDYVIKKFLGTFQTHNIPLTRNPGDLENTLWLGSGTKI
jgi:hypothetical protein